MTRWVGIIVAGIWVTGLPEPAGAEEHALAAPLVGSRVRVFVTSGGVEPVVGTLAAVEDESLTVIVTGRRDPLVLTRSDVVSVKRSVRPSHKRRGALIGSAIGFVAGFVIGGAITEWEGTSGGDFEPEKYVAAGAILALPAAGIGAVVASGKRWAEVPRDQERAGDRVFLAVEGRPIHEPLGRKIRERDADSRPLIGRSLPFPSDEGRVR